MIKNHLLYSSAHYCNIIYQNNLTIVYRPIGLLDREVKRIRSPIPISKKVNFHYDYYHTTVKQKAFYKDESYLIGRDGIVDLKGGPDIGHSENYTNERVGENNALSHIPERWCKSFTDEL